MKIQIILYLDPIAGAALGIGTGMIQDLWQLGIGNQQADQQVGRSKQLMDHQHRKALEMWEKTGYAAQVRQMKEAGINPALLYGMSGGGGQTAQMPTATAPLPETPRHDNVGMGMQAGIQMALLDAQKKKLEAEANKANVEADKMKGVDTEEAKTRIESLLQGIDNERMKNNLLRIEEGIKRMEQFEQQQSQEDRLDIIESQSKILKRQLQLITNDTEISDATKQEKIKIIQQEAIGAVLRNTLMKAQREATEAGTALDTQKVKESINDINIKWRTLEEHQKHTAIEKLMQQFGTDPNREAIRQIMSIFDNIIIPIMPTPAPLYPNKGPLGFTPQK